MTIKTAQDNKKKGEKMRGLENDNIARFETENEYNIPDILPYREKIDCESWIVLSNAVTKYRGNEGIHFYEDDII